MAITNEQMEQFIEAIKTTQEDLTMRDLRKMAIVGKKAMEREMKKKMKDRLKEEVMGSFKEGTENLHKELIETLLDSTVDKYLDEFFYEKEEAFEAVEELLSKFGNKISKAEVDEVISELKEKGVIVNSEDDGQCTSIEFDRDKLKEADMETQLKAKMLMAVSRMSHMK